jgi:hypothetical protein
MKTLFTSMIFGLLFGLISLNANATNFYVTEGSQFKLKPDGILTGLTQFLWTSTDLIAGETITGKIDGATGVLTQTLGLVESNTVRIVKYSFQTGTVNCLSGLVEHTVYVLPKLILTLDGLVTEVCNDFTDLVFNAAVPLITGLPTGITLGDIVWTASEGATGSVGATTAESTKRVTEYTLTKAGKISASVKYVLGTGIPALAKLTGTDGLAEGQVTLLDAIEVPTISLGE